MGAQEHDTVEDRTSPRPRGRPVLRAAVAVLVLAAIAAGATLALSPRLRSRLLRPAPKPLPLRVASTPEGADVFIDDELAGTTPLNAQVAQGEHRVRIVRRGYKPWHELVDPAASPQVSPTLARIELATLVVESDPDRADVFLDEERRGATPVELKDVEAGPHTLRIVKEPLYQAVVQKLELKEGESRRVAVRLESDLEAFFESEIKKTPAKLSNYTELLHVHIGNAEVEKAAATVARAMGALGSAETPPADLGQFFEELRKLFRGQAGPLDPQSRQKAVAALAALLEKLVLASPSEYPRYGPIVTLLSQAGEFEEVYRICEKTVQSPTGRGAVHYYVATVCLGQGDTKNAIRLLERAVELQPALYTARLSLGSAYQRAERLDEALRQYTEAEKHIPASSPYYQGLLQAELARLLVARKDIEGAIARYKRAIAAGAPEASACQWRLQFAELLLEQGRNKEATEQYQQIVKLADPDSTVYRTARIALRRLGEK